MECRILALLFPTPTGVVVGMTAAILATQKTGHSLNVKARAPARRDTAIGENQSHNTVSTVSHVSDNGHGAGLKRLPRGLEQAL